MKGIRVVVPAIALFMIAGVASAVDTAIVGVSAQVQGNCKFLSGGSVSFALDPASLGNATGVVVQPTFWCTKGAAYTITDDDGVNESGTQHQLKHATLNEFIPYSFTYTTAGTGTGRTASITLNLASEISNANYVNASAGSYSDTVTLTINP